MAPKNERCQHSWKHQIDSSWFWNKFCANFIHNKKVAWRSSSNSNPIFNPTMIGKKSDKFQFSPVTVKSVDFVNSFAPVWWTSITSTSSWMLQPLRYINQYLVLSIHLSQSNCKSSPRLFKIHKCFEITRKFTICFIISVLLEASISLIAAPRAEPTRVATCHLVRHLEIGPVLCKFLDIYCVSTRITNNRYTLENWDGTCKSPVWKGK